MYAYDVFGALKSNMDRFIGYNKAAVMYIWQFFKIQYG